MSEVKIQKREYRGWQNCIELSNGIVDLMATTDVGPRIIRFGFKGKDNVFCEVESQAGTTGGEKWKMYGGHRLWHSPEVDPRSYMPDNEAIEYQYVKNGVKLTPPAEAWTNIKKEMEVVLSPDEPRATVIHRITNTGAWDVELSAWSLTVLAAGGTEIMPAVKRETGLLPNWNLVLWPYTRLNDSRLGMGDKYITLRQDAGIEGPLKIGFPNEAGWAAYVNKGQMFIKNYKHIMGAEYPDFGASFETYTCNFMVEMETLSPLNKLKPGGTIEHIEQWSLYDGVCLPEDEQGMDILLRGKI